MPEGLSVPKKKPPAELKKRGRKKIPIDYEKAEKLASIMCTQSEIASVLGIPLGTLDHDPEFLRIHKKGLEHGKASLRRMQYVAASGGNATMQIWLGKQYLEQRDKMDVENTITTEEVLGREKALIEIVKEAIRAEADPETTRKIVAHIKTRCNPVNT
jgi:hypothetical protein